MGPTRGFQVGGHIWLSTERKLQGQPVSAELEEEERGHGMAWHGIEMTFITCCVLVPPVQPSVPEDVEPKEPDYLEDPRAGRFIIPEGIRPVLKEFRIEV